MKTVITSLRIFLFFTVVTGIAYPLLVTGIARLLFPFQANGSLIMKDNRPVGSAMIGQSFDTSQIYFSSRPSAVSYNPLPSGGSNLGWTSRQLKELVERRRTEFIRRNNLADSAKVPPEMLFASGSGLDPHISPEAAMLQVDRVCRARHFSISQEARLKNILAGLTDPPQFLCLGQRRINVLLLNLETDKLK